VTAARTTEQPFLDSRASEGAPPVERRQAPRYLIKQRCVVSLAGTDGPGRGWNCIAYNISAGGIGVLLPLAVQAGTMLQIEPWGLPHARALLARVVYTKPLEFVSLCGCELPTRLNQNELAAWLPQPPMPAPA
jgi:PilZ domain